MLSQYSRADDAVNMRVCSKSDDLSNDISKETPDDSSNTNLVIAPIDAHVEIS